MCHLGYVYWIMSLVTSGVSIYRIQKSHSVDAAFKLIENERMVSEQWRHGPVTHDHRELEQAFNVHRFPYIKAYLADFALIVSKSLKSTDTQVTAKIPIPQKVIKFG